MLSSGVAYASGSVLVGGSVESERIENPATVVADNSFWRKDLINYWRFKIAVRTNPKLFAIALCDLNLFAG